jgi:chromosome segregation ATPase
MKPSQSISRENIDDEYDKLYKKCQDLQDRLDGADLAIGTASTQLQEAEAKLAKAEKERDSYKDAYENMKQFAIDSGLDVTTYG